MSKPKVSYNSHKNGIPLKCKCEYKWHYKGRKEFGYTTCPRCLNKVKIK